MVDPTSVNILLAEPTTGSDSGTWGTPLNGNFTAIDGMFGGQAAISLSSATTILLTVPATGTISAAGGPNQSQNAVIKLTGTLTGNSTIQLQMPKKYVIDNQCTVGAFYVKIAPSAGTGTAVGVPPGEKTQIFYDGTNVDFMGLGRVGSYLDLAVSATPAWMSACSKVPYLVCNGSGYNVSDYPALGAMLGSTFGGNGVTTFGTPDLQGRYRMSIDATGTRITNAGCGINGATFGAAGGSQNHTLTTAEVPNLSYTRSAPTLDWAFNPSSLQSGGSITVNLFFGADPTYSTQSTSGGGGGAHPNVPPALVAGLTFIKT